MLFEHSGLQDDPLIEDAFNYAQNYTQSLDKEILLGYKDLLDVDYEDDLAMLDEDLEDGNITKEEYEQEKSILEMMREEDMQEMFPDDPTEELNRLFRDNCVGPALEIQKYSNNSSPALIATALLATCARDPIDCKKIEERFGAEIAGLIAERLHVNAYPGSHDENTLASSPDAKCLYMAELTNSFREAAAAVKKLGPDELAFLPQEQAETGLAEARLLWGNDKKLDSRLISIFNKAAKTLYSPLSLEIDENGLPELVRNTQKKTKKTPRRKKSSNFGDDGF